MVEAAGKQRVFFALWPEVATATAIARVAEAVGVDGRRVPQSQLHLTLAFVGAVGSSEVPRLLAAAQKITAPAFALQLDQLGYFQRPQIAWLGPPRVPTALRQLATAVTQTAGLDLRLEHFRPHVSLARRASPPRAHGAIEPITWNVRDFYLVESGAGGTPGHYRCLRQWQLQ